MRQVLVVRDGIVSAGVEGLATQDAFHRQPAAVDKSQVRNGFDRVLRARGHKAATRRQERREQFLIQSNERQSKVFHIDMEGRSICVSTDEHQPIFQSIDIFRSSGSTRKCFALTLSSVSRAGANCRSLDSSLETWLAPRRSARSG